MSGANKKQKYRYTDCQITLSVLPLTQIDADTIGVWGPSVRRKGWFPVKKRNIPKFGDFLVEARASRLNNSNYTTSQVSETDFTDEVIVKKGHSSIPSPHGMKMPVSVNADKELLDIAVSVLGDDYELLLKKHDEGTW